MYLGRAGNAQLIGDINGDGLPDRLSLHSGLPVETATPQIWINTGSGFSLAPTSNSYTQSLQSLEYDQPGLEYEQIPADALYPENHSANWVWNGEYGTERTTHAMCSVRLTTRRARLSEELYTRGVEAVTSSWAALQASAGSPSTGFLEPRPSIKLVDLDSDGLADLVISTRVHGPSRHFDCETGNQVDPGVPLSKTVTVVFRNTGEGWENDALAQELEEGLPEFEEVLVKSSYQTWIDEETTDLLVWETMGYAADSSCANLSVRGFEMWYDTYNPDSRWNRSAVCHSLIDLAPQFVDFNGDGYLDLAVLVRDDPNRFSTGNGSYGDGDSGLFFDPQPSVPWQMRVPPSNPARTRVWIQTPGAAVRWQPAPQYDLPLDLWPSDWQYASGFAHVGLQHDWVGPGTQFPSVCLSWSDFTACGPNTYMSDLGVRFVDLNADGLTDVAWSSPRGQAGVLLNMGGGSSPDRYRAWCASEPGDASQVGDDCVDAARYTPPAPLSGYAPYMKLGDPIGMFGDINGDGLRDFVRVMHLPVGTPETASWIHSPSAPGGSVWVRNSRFDPPINGWRSAPHPFDGNSTPIEAFTPRFEAFDVDGDGTDDVVGDQHAILSRSRQSDRLHTMDNGRGGSVAIEYDSMILQRDSTLEEDADGVPWADAAGPVALWRPTAVVSKVTVTGPNIAAPGDVTQYFYAHPRFSLEQRADLGFGLVQRTRPNGSAIGSTIDEYFHQDLGRTGRMARRLVMDAGAVVHRYEATWQHVGAVIPGTIPGVYLARLADEQSANEYGGALGALQTRDFLYNDVYGYNFLRQVDTVRTSTETIRTLLPAPRTADLNPYIVGLVGEQRDADQRSTWVSRSEFTYTDEGRLETERRHRSRGDGSTAPDLTQYFYYGNGNLQKRIDPNLHATELFYDATQSVLVGTKDPLDKTTTFTPDPVFGVPIEVLSPYTDVPDRKVLLDPFGRVVERWETPQNGAPVLVSETVYEDYASAASPPYIEEFQYTGQGNDRVRTVTVDDGFGGTWKTIREAEAPEAQKYVGTATYHIPETRQSRTTYDIACGSDSICSGSVLTGATELAAVTTTMDALGRPLTVQTPDGNSHFHYSRAAETIVLAPQVVEPGVSVDIVLSQNAKGDLARRSFDGDRVVAVEECANSDNPSEPLAQEPCDGEGDPHRTLYGYHGSGQLEVVYDVRAVAGSDWSNASHFLRYSFDTAGNVIRIDDPDAGASTTEYDGVGNVVAAVNARGNRRELNYDALDRLERVLAPEGESTVLYGDGKLQRGSETGPGYTTNYLYDPVGRLAQQDILTGSVTAGASYEYDWLGRPTYIKPLWVNLQGIRYEYAGAFLKQVCRGTPFAGSECSVAIIDDVTYDSLGRRDIVHLPQGVREYLYADDDDDADPSDDETRHLKKDAFKVAGAETAAMAYTQYDGLGNVLDWSTTSPLPGLSATGSYAYDSRNRLVSWSRNTLGETFDYDPLGNLIQHGAVPQRFEHPTKPHALTSRGTNTYAYDQSGNLAQAGNRHFTFDSADRLICVGSSSPGGCDVLRVIYDLSGRRIFEQAGGASGTTRRFVGDEYVHTTDASGEKTARTEIFAFGERVGYIDVVVNAGGAASFPALRFAFEVPPWCFGLPPLVALAWCLGLALRGGLLEGVARRPGSAALCSVLIASLAIPFPVRAGGGTRPTITRWVLSDRLGSGIVEVDEDGLVTSHTRYKPFGGIDHEATAPGGDTGRRYFAGHPQQEETLLQYMNARWMDPDTGTFLSVDPIVSNPSDPQTLNAYSYAGNNPISKIDPTGMSQFECFGSCGGAAGAPPGWQPFTSFSWVTLSTSMGSVTNFVPTQTALHDAGVILGLSPPGTASLDGVALSLETGASQSGGANVYAQNSGQMLDNGTPADPVVRQYIKDFYQAFGPKDKVAGLDPAFRLQLGKVMNDLKAQGFQPRVYDGLRTLAQQQAHVASGASQTMNSLHLVGKAADLADVRTWWTRGGDPFFNALGRSAATHGLDWGGNWTTLVDRVHVQAR